MLKKIVLGLAAVLLVFVVFVSTRPSTSHVERSTQIAAPAEVVWLEVSDFHQWKNWNPWEKLDPGQQTTYEGEPGTVGHKTAWSGEQTGKGSMTIAEANKPTRVKIRLAFLEPFASEADTAIDVAPQDDGVKVTWSMDTENDFMGKMFGLFMDMDEMIGSMYEKGLADLKSIAEANAKKQAQAAAAQANPEAPDTAQP